MLLNRVVFRLLIFHSLLFEKGTFLRLPLETINTGMINCGPNGFRCVDPQSFQVCPVESSDEIIDNPEPVHECKEGFVCDEENIAYCTPLNDYSVATPVNSGRMQNLIPMIDEWERYKKDGVSDRERSLKCGCNQTPPEETEEPTTEFQLITTRITEMPEFECDTFGMFPDYSNNTLFWYCDASRTGKGYIARHMMCEKERVFNPLKQSCMIPEMIRYPRFDVRSLYNSEDSCMDRPPGRYPDKSDCRFYRVCLEDPSMALRNYRFACPADTAFDPITGKCSRYALQRCKDNYVIEQKIIKKSITPDSGNNYCEIPSRFRDIINCYAYYVCFEDGVFQITCPVSYKFDDNAFDCVPEELAQCNDQMEDF